MTENLRIHVPGSHCYDEQELNCEQYGRLYTWESAQEGCRRLGQGWHLPSNEEWRQMARHYGGVRDDSADEGRAAYRTLVAGGRSGFEAMLRGHGWRKAGIDLVRADSIEGARALVCHLLEHGHRRIGLVNGALATSTARDRRKGYRRALANAGLPASPALERHRPFSFPAGEEMGAELLASRRRPTAIFAANPLLAIGVMAAALTRGLRVPEDLALVTFDGVPQLEVVLPFFTAAAQPAYEIGQRAARHLLERFDWRARGEDQPGRETLFKTELMIRRSCGCQLAEGVAESCTRLIGPMRLA